MKTEKDLRDHLLSRAADDDSFRSLLLSNPRGAVKNAFGVDAPDTLTMHVHEDTRTDIHLVIPSRDRLSDDELETVSGAGWVARKYGI